MNDADFREAYESHRDLLFRFAWRMMGPRMPLKIWCTIFVALEEPPGLRLDSTKGPSEMIFIDHVERPAAN